MGQISFGKYVKLQDFNLIGGGVVDALPPISDVNTENSILYSNVKDMYNINNNTLSAIYKSGVLSSDRYAIYRMSPNDLQMKYLGTIDGVTQGVTDYGVASNSQYKYVVQTNPDSDSNVVIQTNFLNIHWNKWSIVSLNYDLQNNVYIPDDTVFLFNNNISAGSVSDNLNIIKYNTLSRFGKVMQNDQMYDSGSLTCLFGDFQSIYNITNTKSLIIEKVSEAKIWSDLVEKVTELALNLIAESNPELEILTTNDQNNQGGILTVVHEEISSAKKILVTQSSSSVLQVFASFLGNNLTINCYLNGDVEIVWIDNFNNKTYRGFAQKSDAETMNGRTRLAVSNLITSMPISYQQQIFCDLNRTDVNYLDCYLYFESNKEYFYYEGQWRPVQKHYMYYDNEEKMALWKQFVSDKKIKLLKNPKGEMWVVALSDQTSRDVNYNTTAYPTTISFNWQEVIDKNDISIIGW